MGKGSDANETFHFWISSSTRSVMAVKIGLTNLYTAIRLPSLNVSNVYLQIFNMFQHAWEFYSFRGIVSITLHVSVLETRLILLIVNCISVQTPCLRDAKERDNSTEKFHGEENPQNTTETN